MSETKETDTWTAAYYFGGGIATGAWAADELTWYAALLAGVLSALLMAAIIVTRRWIDRRVAQWRLAERIRSYEAAQRECANRVFMTGVPHIANERRDGTWEIKPI